MKLTHIRLLVDNFVECFRFYRDVMDLDVRFGEEDGVYTEFEAGDCVLSLFRRDLMADALGQRAGPAGGSDQMVLTLEVDSVDEKYAELLERGVKFEAGPTDRPGWVLRTAHLRDPDGNLIEIYENLETEEHGRPHE